MPGCTTPPSAKNRSEQDVCELHKRVAVSGSWFNDRHGEEVSE